MSFQPCSFKICPSALPPGALGIPSCSENLGIAPEAEAAPVNLSRLSHSCAIQLVFALPAIMTRKYVIARQMFNEERFERPSASIWKRRGRGCRLGSLQGGSGGLILRPSPKVRHFQLLPGVFFPLFPSELTLNRRQHPSAPPSPQTSPGSRL